MHLEISGYQAADPLSVNGALVDSRAQVKTVFGMADMVAFLDENMGNNLSSALPKSGTSHYRGTMMSSNLEREARPEFGASQHRLVDHRWEMTGDGNRGQPNLNNVTTRVRLSDHSIITTTRAENPTWDGRPRPLGAGPPTVMKTPYIETPRIQARFEPVGDGPEPRPMASEIMVTRLKKTTQTSPEAITDFSYTRTQKIETSVEGIDVHEAAKRRRRLQADPERGRGGRGARGGRQRAAQHVAPQQ
jgi:hypothetical protein